MDNLLYSNWSFVNWREWTEYKYASDYFRLPFFFFASGHGNPRTFKRSCEFKITITSQNIHRSRRIEQFATLWHIKYLNIMAYQICIFHGTFAENVTLNFIRFGWTWTGRLFTVFLFLFASRWIFAIPFFITFASHFSRSAIDNIIQTEDKIHLWRLTLQISI